MLVMFQEQIPIKFIQIILIIFLSQLTYAEDISDATSLEIDYMTPYLNGERNPIPNAAEICQEEQGQELSFAFFMQTIASVNCNNLAVSLGISTIENNKLVPSLDNNLAMINFSQAGMCKDDYSGNYLKIYNLVGDCSYQLGKGVFVDGFWGDASLLYSIGKFSIKEGARMSISRLPQGEQILNYFGYKSTRQVTQEYLNSTNATYQKLKHYLVTPKGIKTIQNIYCYKQNPDFKISADYAMSLKLYNEFVKISPHLMKTIRNKPCSEVKDMFCGVGGLLLYEFGTEALLSVISGGLVAGGSGTAGTTSVAGVALAGVTIVKAGGALIKLGKKSIFLLLAAMKYLKRFLPVSTFDELVSYILKNLPTGENLRKIKAGIKKMSLDDLMKPFIRERLATFGKLGPFTPKRVRPPPRIKDLDVPRSIRQSEIDEIFGYSLGDYQDYNTILRGYPGAPQKFGERLQRKFEKLVRGLKKLPPHKSPTYRGTDLTPDELLRYKNAFKEKSLVSDKGFISTTKNKLSTKNYQNPVNNKTPVTMEIRGKSGRDISKISATGHEQEVLFLPNSKFKVVDYKEVDNGVRLILQEI